MVCGASRLISWATAIEAAFCWNVVVNPTIGAPLATSFPRIRARTRARGCGQQEAFAETLDERDRIDGPYQRVRILIIDDLPQVFVGIVREVSRQQMREDPVCGQRLIAWEPTAIIEYSCTPIRSAKSRVKCVTRAWSPRDASVDFRIPNAIDGMGNCANGIETRATSSGLDSFVIA
jgi:hypothetical protein